MSAEKIDFEAVYAAIIKRNEMVARLLSLSPNSPDSRGKNMFELAAEELERQRPSWENLDSPVKKDDKVEIPAGIPVGIVPFGGYVTTKPIEGTLDSTDFLIGGARYMEHGCRRPDPLFHVTVNLDGGKTIDLLVPSWYRSVEDGIYSAVLQKSSGSSSNASIA